MRVSRLQKRPENGIFYYRVVVPKDLVSIVGKREIKVSLKTTNLHHAQRAMFDAAHAIESYFSESRGNIVQPSFIKPSIVVRSKDCDITLDNLVERYFKAQEHQRLSVWKLLKV